MLRRLCDFFKLISTVAIGCAVLVFCSAAAHGQSPSPANSPSAGTSPAARPPLSGQAPQAGPAKKTAAEERLLTDWPYLEKYREADAALPAPTPGEDRVVFMGDSITEMWPFHGPYPLPQTNQFFPGRFYINRGIGGQTTPQMLVRFRQDVIDLHPKAVVILAGTNDIAGNTGPTTLTAIENNLKSMADLARAHGIQVVLCSVLPVYDYPWRPGLHPSPKIIALNQWMKSYAVRKGDVYVDYYSAMVDSRGGMQSALTIDGVHPNKAGFKIMTPLAQAGIDQALKSSAAQ